VRTGGASVVKNEADIVEVFVRHNLVYLDELHVVDNGSTDGTWEILQELVSTVAGLRISRDFRTDHPQEHLMSALLAEWHDPKPDWVFCLDADEFVEAASRQDFQSAVAAWPTDECVALWWDFYVPTVHDAPDEPNPIRRITHRRADHPADGMLTKVVVPQRFLGQPDLWVRAGNHYLAQANGVILPHPIVEQPRLAHFPIRSASQVARKAVIGAWAVSARANRDPHEASHWEEVKNRVLAGEVLTAAELTDRAYNYAVSERLPRVEPADYVIARQPIDTPVDGLPLTPEIGRAFVAEAIAFADAHFSGLRQVAIATPQVSVVKTTRGLIALTAATPSTQARALRDDFDPAGAEIDFCVDAVAGGNTVWDFGAGIGYQTVALGRRVGPNGRVVAVETDRQRRQDLAANLTLNGLRNVVVAESLQALAADFPDAAGGPRRSPVSNSPRADSGRRSSGWLRRLKPSDSHVGTGTTAAGAQAPTASGDASPGVASTTSTAPAPALVRIDRCDDRALDFVAALPSPPGPILFLSRAQDANLGDLRSWAQMHDYAWFWFFSASAADSPEVEAAPRVAIVGVPQRQPSPSGLQPMSQADTSWPQAWERAGRRWNSAPTRWAMSRHGLDERWH
jgi:hypothetical protein